MFQREEADSEQDARVHAVVVQSNRILCDRLCAAAQPGGWEAYFLRRDPATFDHIDRMTLRRIAWFYRLRLPSHLRPAKNPDDPIVRESEFADG